MSVFAAITKSNPTSLIDIGVSLMKTMHLLPSCTNDRFFEFDDTVNAHLQIERIHSTRFDNTGTIENSVSYE